MCIRDRVSTASTELVKPASVPIETEIVETETVETETDDAPATSSGANAEDILAMIRDRAKTKDTA